MKLTFFFVFIPFFIFSQNDSITHSKFYERVSASHDNYYFNIDDDIFYVKILNENLVLEKFSLLENRLVSSNKFPALNKNEKFEKIIKIGNKYYLFFSYWDKKNKLEQLFSMEIDFNNLIFKRRKKILENDKKLNGKFVYKGQNKYETLDKYNFSISKNEKNLLISFQIKATTLEINDRAYKAKIGINVFDENLNQKGKIYEMPSSYILSSYFDFLITNNNEVYILSEVFENEGTTYYVGKNKNYHLELLKLVEGSIDIIKLDEKDYFIRDIKIIEGIDNEIVIAGYYLERGFLTNIDGIYYSKIKNDQLLISSYFKIPVNMINLYETESKQRKNLKLQAKGKLDFPFLALNEIELDDLGNIIIIGEQYKEKETFISNVYNSLGNWYKFYFNSIFVVKLSGSGDLLWMNKIPKNQYGDLFQDFLFYNKINALGNLSFKYLVRENKLFFLYWDKSLNLKLSKNESPREYTDDEWGKLFCVEINHLTGEMSKKIMLKPVSFMSDKYNARDKYFRMPINNLEFTEKGVFFEIRDFGKKSPKENVAIQIYF